MDAATRHRNPDETTRSTVSALSTVIDEFVGSVASLPNYALQVAKQSLIRTGYLLLMDPAAEHEETRSSIRLAAQAGSAFFAAANSDQDEVEHTVGSTVAIKTTRPTPNHDPGNWIDALWASVICRDQRLVDGLCRVPLETLRTGGNHDEYMFAWADSLQAFFRGDPALYAKINHGIELADPDSLSHTTPETALFRHFPAMKALFGLAAGDPGRFNEDLAEAAALHKRFWEGEPGRASRPEGFFALGPTALAALAHENGIEVTVASDYLPRNFVEGTGFIVR